MDEAKYKLLPFNYKIARFSLLLRKAYPFLGELCIRVEKYRKELRAPAATDGYHLYLNEKLLDELPQEAFNFVLLHELFHIVLRHTFPKDMLFYEKIYWNVGFDLVANWLITSMERELRSNQLPVNPIADTFLSPDDLSKDPSNIIVDAFLQQAKQQGILSANPPAFVEIKWKSFEAIVPNGADYVFDILDRGDGPYNPTDADIQGLLDSCLKTAGNTGLPAYLRDLMSELIKGRKLPWHMILKRYLDVTKAADDFSFCPPDKRMLHKDIILPGESDSDKALNDALIVLDVSSSVDKEQLLTQIWQIRTVLSDLEFEGSIVAFASDVHQEAPLNDKKSLNGFIDKLQVGGGTAWAKVIQHIKERKWSKKPIIVFTDGYLFSFDTGLSDVIFITYGEPPDDLKKLGKVIQIS